MADFSKTCRTCACDSVCDHYVNGWETCGNWISADAVEVVRCKDCRKRKTPDCSMYYEYYEDGDTEQHSWEVDEDFCSVGERK